MNKFYTRINFFLISIGAVPAALMRWRIDDIFLVNIIGCFLLGFINALSIPKKYKLFLGFGFCGSLTTFSGWTSYLYELIINGYYHKFFFSSISIVTFGILAVAFGNFLSHRIIK